jgi:copper(I)-binding protein
MRISSSSFFPGVAIAAILILAAASGARAAAITIEGAWIRALPPSIPSGGYFTLRNGGSKTIILTGADSPACGSMMLHLSQNHGGMNHMTHVTEVDVPAGGTLAFAPGSYHLMCMAAKPVLKPGAAVPVTLRFQDGQTLAARFQVRSAAGK